MQSPGQVCRQTLQSVWDKKKPMTTVQRALIRWAMVDDDQAILEVSCKRAALLRHYLDHFYVRACGLCRDYAALHALRTDAPEAEWMMGTPADIPWQNGTFSVVLASSVSEEPTQARVRELCRVLQPGGRVVMGVSLLPSLWNDGSATGLAGLHILKKWMASFSKAGFDDVSVRFGGFGCPVLLARDYMPGIKNEEA